MTTTTQTRAAKRAPMDHMRKTALVAGVFYLVTFISIPTLKLYHGVLTNHQYITHAGSNSGVLWGALLEVIVALAGIGTAVTLFPVVKRENEAAALGFVTTRVIEGAMIFVGVLSVLSILTRRHDMAGASGANAASLVTTATALAAVYKWTFLLGQTLMPALNALLLGSLLYRSRLVPRILPMLGLIGAPILIASVIAAMFRINHPIMVLAGSAHSPSRSGSSSSASGSPSRASTHRRLPPPTPPPQANIAKANWFRRSRKTDETCRRCPRLLGTAAVSSDALHSGSQTERTQQWQPIHRASKCAAWPSGTARPSPWTSSASRFSPGG